MVNKIDVPEKYWDSVYAPSSCFVMNTTVDKDGRINAASYGTCTRVNHEPIHIAYTVNTDSDSYSNVMETGEFVVNVVPFDPEILGKALIVGMPFKKGVNELEKAKLTAIPSKAVRPPRIAECRTHFECKVVWTKEWIGRCMIVGKVVAASIDEGCMGENGGIVWDKVKPAHYCGGFYRKFVPANQPFEARWKDDGTFTDDDFIPGSDWRTRYPKTK